MLWIGLDARGGKRQMPHFGVQEPFLWHKGFASGLRLGDGKRFTDLTIRVWSKAVRRRRRPHVGVAPVPFSLPFHVMLYTSYIDVARFL